MRNWAFFSALTVLAGLTCAALAAEPANARREKKVVFDETRIESANKGPSDYAGVTNRYKDRKRPHLYSKGIGIDKDLEETLGEMRYSQ